MPPEVWITGVGIISALGSGLDAHADAARAARSGLKRHRFFDGAPPDPCMAGLVDAKDCTSIAGAQSADRADILLDHALAQCLTQASVVDRNHIDCIAGTTLGNMAGATAYYRSLRGGGTPELDLVRHALPCAPLLRAAKKQGLRGKCLTVSSACGSGMAALGHAFRRIRSGRATQVIAGGFDTLSPFIIAGFNSLRLVSAKECRPFDRDRDGLNPGEAAAMLMLESKESAEARGAQPLAKVAGFGDALDAFHHTRAHPEGLGLRLAMEKALAGAALESRAIDHVHLHGTGTAANDESEYHACKSLFGNRLADIPACSTKSMTGHTFGAAGALNASFAVTSLNTGIVPPTLFLENRDPSFTDLAVSPGPVKIPAIGAVMCTALGFGGESFALILTKADRS